MPILYRENVAYEVPEGLVAVRLTQGFSRGVLDPQRKAAIAPDEPAPEVLINVNTCLIGELTALKGIGSVAGNEIIDGRPYDSLEWFNRDPRTVPHIDKFTL